MKAFARLTCVLSVILAVLAPPGSKRATVIAAATLPPGFVAEKSGIIKVFDNLADPSATVFADLRTNVFNYWDRGLLSLALDPDFPAKPYIYVLYTFDGPIGGTAPTWGMPGVTSDGCPDPPGGTTLGCAASGRVSRLEAAGNVMKTGSELVLVHN